MKNRTISILCSLIFLIAIGVGCAESEAQEINSMRTWTDATGRFRVEASLVSFDASSVVIRKKDGVVTQLRRTQLHETDVEFLKAAHALKQTSEQASLLIPHVAAITGRVVSTIDILDALTKQYPAAVGSQFYSGLLLAVTGESRGGALTRAARQLDEVIVILETIEATFPGRHRRTLASALNNRAVLAVRQKSFLGAVNFLSESAEVSREAIPFATYHNAAFLLSSNVDLGATRGKLAGVLAKGSPEDSAKVASRLMFTFDHDVFVDATVTAAERSDESPMPSTPAPAKFLLGSGSGFLIAPDLVLTNRHVADEATAFLVKNDAGVSIVARAAKVSSSVSIDLALLKLERPASSRPIAIRTELPKAGESFVVLGYPLPDEFEPTITASRGIVSKLVENNLHILHDASTDAGNSGGPCIDRNGNVIGVHFAGSSIGKNNRNFAISPVGIQTFLSDVGDYQGIVLSNENVEFDQIIDRLKDSVFLIECYGNQLPSTRIVAVNQSNPFDPMRRFSLIADFSCMRCFGKGYLDCPSCVNGLNTTSKVVNVGANPFTGKPISAAKNFKVPCEVCNRAGKLRCPTCSGSGWSK